MSPPAGGRLQRRAGAVASQKGENEKPGRLRGGGADDAGPWAAGVFKTEEVIFIWIDVYGYHHKLSNKTLLYAITNALEELNTAYFSDLVAAGGDE